MKQSNSLESSVPTSEDARLIHQLVADNKELQKRLTEAEDALLAIRSGVVDAIVWNGHVVSIGERLAELTEANSQLEAARLVILTKLEEATAARREAEQILVAWRSSELQYRIIADYAFDWEFWLNPDRQFVYNSPSSERITGYKPSDFAADPQLMERIIHAEDLPRFLAYQEAVLRSPQGTELEFRVIRADGGVRWIAQTSTPIRSDAGEFLGVRGSNRDITERKQIEFALRKAK